MSNAREIAQLRRILYERLPPAAFDSINMTTLARATARLTDLKWTPHDIASQILGDYGEGNPAALIITRIQNLNGPPPRDHTPTPPPIDRLALARDQRNAANVNHTAWAARIRADLHQETA